jgi:ABC-type Fe3+-siderophore transport system permease subunit
MSDTFPVLNGMKLGAALSSFIFIFALEYFIWKVAFNSSIAQRIILYLFTFHKS